jgi:hypothetical protein
VDWVNLASHRYKRWAVLKAVINFQVQLNVTNFFTFSSTLLHGFRQLRLNKKSFNINISLDTSYKIIFNLVFIL